MLIKKIYPVRVVFLALTAYIAIEIGMLEGIFTMLVLMYCDWRPVFELDV